MIRDRPRYLILLRPELESAQRKRPRVFPAPTRLLEGNGEVQALRMWLTDSGGECNRIVFGMRNGD